MRQVMAGWLVAFSLLLRAVASLGMPGIAAAVATPTPALSVHLNSN